LNQGKDHVRAAGPVVDPVPCSGCGKLIDPLRAGHVAIFDHRFHFFCNRVPCRASFLGEEVRPESTPPRPEARPHDELRERRTELDAPILPAFAPQPDAALPEPPAPDDDRALVEPIAQTILTDEPSRFDAAEPRDVSALLLVIAVVAGALAVALALAGDTRLVIVARIVLAAVGVGMLLGRAATTARDACDPHPAAVLASAVGTLAVAIWAALGDDRALGAEAASLVGIVVTAAAVSAWLVESARRQVSLERAWIAAALAVPGRRLEGESAAGESVKNKVFDLRAGEQVIVDAGEIVPVDMTITGGDVEVMPWIGATTPVRRRPGDPIVAGAQVVRGRLRVRGVDLAPFIAGDNALLPFAGAFVFEADEDSLVLVTENFS